MAESSERKLDLDIVRKTAAHLLSFLNPKDPFGKDLFDAVARVTVTLTVEVIPWRIGHGRRIEILLIRRKPDESDPGVYHTPGTAIRCGEEIEEDTIPRLAKRELGKDCNFSDLRFVGNLNNVGEARGHFFSPVYTAQVTSEPANGEWWPIDSLPPVEDTVTDHSLRLWPMAIQAIQQDHSNG